MEAPEAILYSVRAKDEDGNVYEASVRAANEEDAVAPLRARGLIDAEALPVEPEARATDTDARQAWQRFQEDLKDLPDTGRPFGPSVAEAARAAAAEPLDYKSHGLSDDAETFLAAVKETVSRTGNIPDLRAAHAAQQRIDTQWRALTQGTFSFLRTLLTLLTILWLLTAVSSAFSASKNAVREFYADYDIERPYFGRQMENALSAPVVFAWLVVLGVGSSLTMGHVWRAAARRGDRAPTLQMLAEGLAERWLFLGRVLRTNRRARFIAAMAALSRSEMPPSQAALIAAALAGSPRRTRRAKRLQSEWPDVQSYDHVIAQIEGVHVSQHDADQPPFAALSGFSESIVQQTSALCGRLTTITIGLSAVLAGLVLIPGALSPLSLFANLFNLMNAMGGY